MRLASLFIFLSFTSFSQLDSLEGHWLMVNDEDSTILHIRKGSKRKQVDENVLYSQQRSNDRTNQGVFYYIIQNNRLVVLNAFGQEDCTSDILYMSGQQIKIGGDCRYTLQRITEKEFNAIKKQFEAFEKANKWQDINLIDN